MARQSFSRSPGQPKKQTSFKYASRYVGSRMDIVSEKVLTLVKKNPKAVSKALRSRMNINISLLF